MPWAISDVDSKKKGLTDRQKEKWVSIANDIYNRTGNKGMAIRIANAKCVESIGVGKMQSRRRKREDVAVQSSEKQMRRDLQKLRDEFNRLAAKSRTPEEEERYREVGDRITDIELELEKFYGPVPKWNPVGKVLGYNWSGESKEVDTVSELTGKTKAVIDFVKKHWDSVLKQAKENIISPDKYWAFLTSNLSKDLGLFAEDLVLAGMDPRVVVNSFDYNIPIEEQVSSSYKTLIMKKEDGSVVKISLNDILPKLEKHTKSFESPMDALRKGNKEDVLKVLKGIYGDDVTGWTVPVETPERAPSKISKFTSLIITEMMKRKSSEIDDKFINVFSEAFDKGYVVDLMKLMPNCDPEYLKALVNETRTALDNLGSEVVTKLFPNCDPEYLKCLKEKRVGLRAAVRRRKKKVTEQRGTKWYAMFTVFSRGAEDVRRFSFDLPDDVTDIKLIMMFAQDEAFGVKGDAVKQYNEWKEDPDLFAEDYRTEPEVVLKVEGKSIAAEEEEWYGGLSDTKEGAKQMYAIAAAHGEDEEEWE